MDHGNNCDHSNCINSANESVRQTLSELDWERGIWNAGDKDRVQLLVDRAKNAKELVTSVDNSGYTALHYAARNGHIGICAILLSNGALINTQTRSGKATPLFKATAASQEETVKFLINQGAQINLQDADGKTPLHKAVENKHYAIINILLEACPDIKNIKDNKGNLAIV